jgi:hypothetical protein
MRRIISSAWTVPFKAIIPLVWVIISILLIFSLFAYSSGPTSDALIGVLLVISATAFFCWWGMKLKRVSVDDSNLYVSNLIKEIPIPLSEIASVTDFQGGWPVMVHLRAKSEFGHTIFFLATWKPLLFSSPHPIIEELRQLAKLHV